MIAAHCRCKLLLRGGACNMPPEARGHPCGILQSRLATLLSSGLQAAMAPRHWQRAKALQSTLACAEVLLVNSSRQPITANALYLSKDMLFTRQTFNN